MDEEEVRARLLVEHDVSPGRAKTWVEEPLSDPERFRRFLRNSPGA